jgi:predicted amidohydrolase YtcJ
MSHLVLYNGKLHTQDPGYPQATAVAIGDGRILAVGNDAEIKSLAGPNTQTIDLGGRLVLPGFTDCHIHFQEYALRRSQVILDGVDDWQEMQRRIQAGVEHATPGEWVLGGGWNQNLWGDGSLPSKADLDNISTQNPVALSRTDGHSTWVNSLALEKAGITAETPDPPGSCIDRDPDSGEPTGILREWEAIRLVQDIIPKPDDETIVAALQASIAEAHRLGLTGIHEMPVEGEKKPALRSFLHLRQQGELPLRVVCMIPVEHLDEAIALGLGSGLGDATLRVGGVKLFADGSMGSSTAWMLEPFEGNDDNYGLVVTPTEELFDVARRAQATGISLTIHAIGDRAIRAVLDALTEIQGRQPSTLRHRIEHVQCIHPSDVHRLAQLGVIASMQPPHIMDDWAVADRVWGKRGRCAYAFRSLLDAGTHLAFGSDCPVAPLNPLLGIQAAVLRQDRKGEPEGGWYPGERLTVAEAVRGYTLEAAYAVGLEDVLGSITPGKLADMVVLSCDIFAIPPEEISNTQVDYTIFDGRLVYRRGD